MSAAVTPAPAKVSFWKKIGNFFARVASATTEQKVNSILHIVSPVIEEVVSLVGGPIAGTATEDLLGTVQSKLAAVSALAGAVDIPGTKGFSAHAANIITGIHDNLAELLSAAGVKNSAKADAITGLVNMVDGELGAVFQTLAPAGSAVTGSAV